MGIFFRIRKAFLGRSIEAAAPGRRWAGLKPMTAPKASIHASRSVVMGRARSLVSSNALAANGVEVWVSGLIGSGIVGASAHSSEGARRRIDKAWRGWLSTCDADGRNDFYGLQALVIRRVVVDGEALVLMTLRNGRLRLRVLPSESLAPYSRELGGGRRIVEGIEFDADGRRIAYWIYPDAPGQLQSLQPVRIDARDVLHIFRADHPGQLRGLSWFAPVLLSISEHAKLSDAAILQQQIAAMLTGFVRRPDGDAAGLFEGERDGSAVMPSLEPGTMVALEPGQEVIFSQPPKADGAKDLLKVSAREIAAGLAIQYEALTGDLESVNYSSIRSGSVEFRRKCEALQYGLIAHQLLNPIFQRFVATEALAGRLYAPGHLEPYLAAEWFPAKNQWVDPLKDAQAEIAAINAGLMSRTEALAARGWSAGHIPISFLMGQGARRARMERRGG